MGTLFQAVALQASLYLIDDAVYNEIDLNFIHLRPLENDNTGFEVL